MKIKITESNNSSMKVGDVFDVHESPYGETIVTRYGTEEYLKYLKVLGVCYVVFES